MVDGELGKACTTPVFRSLQDIGRVGLAEGFPHLWRDRDERVAYEVVYRDGCGAT